MKAFSFFSTMALALTLSVASVHAATDVYGVTGVQSGEFLNMRSDAGVSNAITGRIPFNGQGIVTTGEEKRSVAHSGQKCIGTGSVVGSANAIC